VDLEWPQFDEGCWKPSDGLSQCSRSVILFCCPRAGIKNIRNTGCTMQLLLVAERSTLPQPRNRQSVPYHSAPLHIHTEFSVLSSNQRAHRLLRPRQWPPSWRCPASPQRTPRQMRTASPACRASRPSTSACTPGTSRSTPPRGARSSTGSSRPPACPRSPHRSCSGSTAGLGAPPSGTARPRSSGPSGSTPTAGRCP
jgi:hypothetical protein